MVEKNEQFYQCTVVKPDNSGIYILATPCCHEASCHNTFTSDDAEMDALIYRPNICKSPAITADNRATLHGIAQHHVVVRPTLDPDSMIGLTHSGAATPRIRIRGHDQIPQTGIGWHKPQTH